MMTKEALMKDFVKALMDRCNEGASDNISRLKISIAKELNLGYVPSNL